MKVFLKPSSNIHHPINNMKDKKRAMGRGLGAILNAESKTNINTASDKVQL
jgi:hypothetical protein